MKRPVLTGFLIYLAWSGIRGFFRFLGTPFGMAALFVALVWGAFGSSNFMKRHNPYPQTATVTDAVIKWAYGSGPYILERYHVNWIGITIESTYERPYHPNMLACFIRGPVYHTDRIDYQGRGGFMSRREADADGGTYMGERQLIVKLIPVGEVAFKDPVGNPVTWPMPVIAAAERPYLTPWEATVPVQAEFIYVVVPPQVRLLPDDKVVGCGIHERDHEVDAKVGWVGPHGDMSLDDLADTEVDPRAVQAIMAAVNGGS